MVQRFESVEEPTRIGEYVVARVGECDVAHAECSELAQCAEGVTELVASVRGVRSQGWTLKREEPGQTLLYQ